MNTSNLVPPETINLTAQETTRATQSSSTVSAIIRAPEAAKYIGLAESTLAKSRLYGWGPKHIKLGARAVGYRISDLDAWLLARERNSTHPSDRAA